MISLLSSKVNSFFLQSWCKVFTLFKKPHTYNIFKKKIVCQHRQLGSSCNIFNKKKIVCQHRQLGSSGKLCCLNKVFYVYVSKIGGVEDFFYQSIGGRGELVSGKYYSYKLVWIKIIMNKRRHYAKSFDMTNRQWTSRPASVNFWKWGIYKNAIFV